MMRALFLLIASIFAVHAQAVAEPIAVDSPRWQFTTGETKKVEHAGKVALYLKGAAAILGDANFESGTIEFDMFLPSMAQSFPGLYFRGIDGDNYEHFYLRPHQVGRPDSMQYTPVINGVTAWQIYPEYNGRLNYPINIWFHIRAEIADDSARVFVDNMDKPALIVDDLKRDRAPGFILLKGSLGGAYFANITVTPGAVSPVVQANAVAPVAGTVNMWSISPAMAEAAAIATATNIEKLTKVKWTKLGVENSGIANLARVAVRTDATPTVLARTIVRADRDRTVSMRFGFSDRVTLFLNGVALYSGDDTQNSRDYRFLGTVGLYDSVALPLRRGENAIIFAISEGGGGDAIGGGGWAVQAAFPVIDGLKIIAP